MVLKRSRPVPRRPEPCDPRRPSRREGGFAIAFALLMIMILTLLGASLLLVATTENRIAENERLSAQALYAAEAGARLVKRWFDHPGSSTNVANPGLSAIDRTLRLVDAPPASVVAADGSSVPYYKQGVDLNANGADDVFDQPFRGSLKDTLLGTEAGPDMRISDSGSTAARTFLRSLSASLFGDYPGRSLQARISSIDVYGPPNLLSGGTWTRFGMGTVKVVARIYQDLGDGSERFLAERMVKTVLNEIPYNPGDLGPLHSCDTLSWNGDFTVHWGTTTAVTAADLTNNHKKMAGSWPRVETGGEHVLWGYDSAANFDAYLAAVENTEIEDPWLQLVFGGQLADAPNADLQPWPFTWTSGALGDGHYPAHVGSNDATHSNVFQNEPGVGCPEMPYELWKTIATTGGPDVHYYTWAGGTTFKENGQGSAVDFRAITDNQTGLFFFDTVDGIAPHDDDADGEYDNLTPAISISGGDWGVRGIVYLNALSFKTHGVDGRAVTFNAPGEPYRDANLNGKWDSGEEWVNLDYPTTLTGTIKAKASNKLQDDGTTGSSAVRNSHGPSIAGFAVLWGILYTNGYWDAKGNGVYYGSVISKIGIGEYTSTAGTPELYWDASLDNNWPPDSWSMPRVAISRWETDL